MPHRVQALKKRLERYRALAGDALIAEIRDRAHDLRELRVLEMSATATGGGVAELLSSLVPLQQDLGLHVESQLTTADADLFALRKQLHNGLQGMKVEIAERELQDCLAHNEAHTAALSNAWDVIIVHDPQPAAVRSFASSFAGR